MTGPDQTRRRARGRRAPDLLTVVAIVAAAAVAGVLAVRLYDTYLRAEPPAPRPIRIFRSPSSNDYSAIAAAARVG